MSSHVLEVEGFQRDNAPARAYLETIDGDAGSEVRTVPTVYCRYVIARAVALGHDPRRLLRLAGIDPLVIDDDVVAVTPQKFSRLLTGTALVLRDELLGYGPRRVAPGAWAMMCRATFPAATLGEALHRICRFWSLFEGGIHPRLTIEDGNARVEFIPPRPDYQFEIFLIELLIFTLHRFMCWMAKEFIPLHSLIFAHARPYYADRTAGYFVTTLLKFDGPRTSLTFDAAYLGRPVRQTASSLQAFLKSGYVDLFTTPYAPPSWSSRLKAIIGRDLNSIPEFEDVSRGLAIHPQTLRRRLAEEGATYRDLKVEVRREAAILLLRSSEMTMEEIASEVGFSAASAFCRAFVEWTGQSPRAYRTGRSQL